jgi:hypothetical protein
MCIWIYQEFDCSHQTLLHVDDCLESMASLPCKVAEKETSPSVGPSENLCQKCYSVESPNFGSGMSTLSKLEKEKLDEHNEVDLQATSNIPETTYWSDSSS